MNAIEIFLSNATVAELTLIFIAIPGLASIFTIFASHILKEEEQ